jgi:hypothetical protein
MEEVEDEKTLSNDSVQEDITLDEKSDSEFQFKGSVVDFNISAVHLPLRIIEALHVEDKKIENKNIAFHGTQYQPRVLLYMPAPRDMSCTTMCNSLFLCFPRLPHHFLPYKYPDDIAKHEQLALREAGGQHKHPVVYYVDNDTFIDCDFPSFNDRYKLENDPLSNLSACYPDASSFLASALNMLCHALENPYCFYHLRNLDDDFVYLLRKFSAFRELHFITNGGQVCYAKCFAQVYKHLVYIERHYDYGFYGITNFKFEFVQDILLNKHRMIVATKKELVKIIKAVIFEKPANILPTIMGDYYLIKTINYILMTLQTRESLCDAIVTAITNYISNIH